MITKSMKTKLIYWLPPILWICLIFLVSNRPAVRTTEIYLTDFILKKTAHLIEYAVLSVLLFRSLRNTTSFRLTQLIALALALTIFYSVTDEIHQTFVPSREGRVRDVIIDAVGASTALFFLTHLPLSPSWLRRTAKAWQLTS